MEIPESDVVRFFIEKLPDNLNVFNLKDLRASTDSLDIRIWQTHEIFTASCNDSFSSNYKIHTTNDKPIFSTFNFSKNISRDILNSFLATGVMELHNDNYRGIDGSFIFIEISTKQMYKVVSFWSPNAERNTDCKAVVEILDKLNKTINSKDIRNEFLNSLEPGGYRWGMTSIQIDKFLSSDIAQTDFYSMPEEKIKTELKITQKTNHWEYPIVIINDKPAKIEDLNKYSKNDVESFEILKPDNNVIALYGTMGNNGIIKMKTK
jgi:hypothetical protein